VALCSTIEPGFFCEITSQIDTRATAARTYQLRGPELRRVAHCFARYHPDLAEEGQTDTAKEVSLYISKRGRKEDNLSERDTSDVVRGWGHHYNRAHVRKLFHRLDGWLVRRIWSHRHRKWRCCGWKTLPRSQLYGEYRLVNLVAMIPSLATQRTASS
jgi:hypothetical protein